MVAAIRAGTAPRATPEVADRVADRVAMLVVVDRAGTEGKQAEEAGMGTAATGEETRNLIIRNCSTYVPSGFDQEKPQIFAKAF